MREIEVIELCQKAKEHFLCPYCKSCSGSKNNKYGKNLNDEFYDTDQFICSECGLHLQDWEKIIGDGEIEEFEFKFCPNCGADMRERKETDER